MSTMWKAPDGEVTTKFEVERNEIWLQEEQDEEDEVEDDGEDDFVHRPRKLWCKFLGKCRLRAAKRNLKAQLEFPIGIFMQRIMNKEGQPFGSLGLCFTTLGATQLKATPGPLNTSPCATVCQLRQVRSIFCN